MRFYLPPVFLSAIPVGQLRPAQLRELIDKVVSRVQDLPESESVIHPTMITHLAASAEDDDE